MKGSDGMKCCTCKYGVDYGESVEFIKCERGKRSKHVEKKQTCKEWVKKETATAVTDSGINEK